MKRMTTHRHIQIHNLEDTCSAKVAQLRCLVAEMDDDTLRRLRAIINGKLGKRKISAEQQTKMQAARKRKVI